jgi:hypothetical protein
LRGWFWLRIGCELVADWLRIGCKAPQPKHTKKTKFHNTTAYVFTTCIPLLVSALNSI